MVCKQNSPRYELENSDKPQNGPDKQHWIRNINRLTSQHLIRYAGSLHCLHCSICNTVCNARSATLSAMLDPQHYLQCSIRNTVCNALSATLSAMLNQQHCLQCSIRNTDYNALSATLSVMLDLQHKILNTESVRLDLYDRLCNTESTTV